MKPRDEVGVQAVWLLGFALFEVWSMAALGDWRGVGNVLTAFSGNDPLLPCIQSGIITLLLIVFVFLYPRIGETAFSPIILGTITLLGLVISLALLVGNPSPELSVALSIGLQILLRYLFLAWFKAFFCFDIEIILTFVLSLLAATEFFTTLIALLPPAATVVFVVFAALFQLFSLQRISKTMPFVERFHTNTPTRNYVLILGAALIFCIFFRLLGSAAKRADDEPILGVFCGTFYSEFSIVVILLSVGVLAATFLNRKKAPRSFSAIPFGLAGAFILGSIILLIGFPGQRGFALHCLGQTSIDLIFIIFFLLLGKQQKCSSFKLFLLSEIVFTGSYLIVGPLVSAMHGLEGSMLPPMMTGALIISSQSVVVFFFIMGNIMVKNDLSESLKAILTAFEKAFSSHDSSPEPEDAFPSECAIPADEVDSKEESPLQDETREGRGSTMETMAHLYKFSERESEVATLLIKGRSMKRAAEELYLSLGTVNTYAKRIYAKMDIHSRQELIDCFEVLRHQNLNK